MMMIKPPAPTSESELLKRAEQLAGLTVGDVAKQLNLSVPATLHQAKGWIGQLLEQQLGTTAGNQSLPDFHKLGIELKTIPINAKGQVRESTYICTVPLLPDGNNHWRRSNVYQKLAKVLWIPIEMEKSLSIAERRIGPPLLWQPDSRQEAILQADWEELTTMINTGKLADITARMGHYLQIRPKAANANALTWAINEQGEKTPTLPRGFYLRTQFTRLLLQAHFIS